MRIDKSSYLNTVKVFNSDTKCQYCQCVFTIEPEDKFEKVKLENKERRILVVTLRCPECKKQLDVWVPCWAWCENDADIMKLYGYPRYLENRNKMRQNDPQNKDGDVDVGSQNLDDVAWLCRDWKAAPIK